jgi:GntR family transcriptional regulator, arabinose operon transcriptional repressor
MANPFENVKQKPRYERIYSELKTKIIDKQIRPGEKLPTEKELIDYYQVSRITTKKALDMLVSDNLIKRIPGKGSFVISGDENSGTEIKTKNRPLLIGYVVPDFDDSHGLELFLSAEKMAAQTNMNIVVKRTYGDVNREKEAINALLELEVDGMVILPVSGEYYNEEIVKLNIQKFPHVLIDRYLKGFSTTSVCTDNRGTSKQCVHYLFDMNHDKISLIAPPFKDTSAIEDRIDGFIQAYAERGVSVDKDLWLTSLTSTLPFPKNTEEEISQDIEMIKEHLKKFPEISAVFAMEYNVAVLVKEAAAELNMAVPADLSIICYDHPLNTIGRHRFTHIKQDVEKMTGKALEGVAALIEGREFPVKTTLDAELIIDTSTVAKKV